MVFLDYSQDQQVTCSWSMCSIISKNVDNIFQHWENPGFIQDWEQHVQYADLEEKHKFHGLGQYAQEFVKK